jgi:hypothetical protein
MRQRVHADSREICDYNPVGKPVGLLVMEAASAHEVSEHVSGCEVYVDTKVTIERLLTPTQALAEAETEYDRYCVGVFRRERG